MITNERQYRITKAQTDRFQVALAHVDEEYGNQDPILRQAMRDQIESQLSDLRAELEAYERIRASGGSTLQLRSVEELPEALIWARIASGLTQRELASLIGVSDQQVQRDEATMYAGASFERLVAIGRVLGMETAVQITLPVTAQRTVDVTRAETRAGVQQPVQSTDHVEEDSQYSSNGTQVEHVSQHTQ